MGIWDLRAELVWPNNAGSHVCYVDGPIGVQNRRPRWTAACFPAHLSDVTIAVYVDRRPIRRSHSGNDEGEGGQRRENVGYHNAGIELGWLDLCRCMSDLQR